MKELTDILTINEPIPATYRKGKTLDVIRADLENIDFTKVTNPHLFNLRSLVMQHFDKTTKKVVGIYDNGIADTGDLEIDNDAHSYWANGIPVHNTTNLPNDYPFEDFKNIYINAHKTGYIKGVTTYRAGTMATVLKSKDDDVEQTEQEEIIIDDVELPDTSNNCRLTVLRAEGRKWYLNTAIHESTNLPYAIFVHTNNPEKSTTTNDAVERLIALARTKGIPERHVASVEKKIENDSNTSKITRVISLLLRHGVLIKNIVYELEKVENVFAGSFIFAIRKHLGQFVHNGEKVKEADGKDTECASCGATNSLVYQDGCVVCSSCGNSKCG